MLRWVQKFLQLEAASGIVLVLAAVLAFAWSNSPWAVGYHQLFNTGILFWINEGLMTIFFLLIGLELKREFLEGELSTISQITLPAMAAFGGMIIPALIYVMMNFSQPLALRGWAVPVATDIAFALGVLSLFGKRIPVGLKFFLMALAVFDDLGAILIIAVLHTTTLSYVALGSIVLILVVLYLLNRLSVSSIWVYLLGGIILWASVLQSGIHATIAGVLLALVIPLKTKDSFVRAPLHRLEYFLHPLVAFFIMPLFALANAGLSLHGSGAIWFDSVTLGIFCGLFLGKQLGVFGFSWLMIRLRLATLPEQTSWLLFYGVAILCGIGFTMSIFLGNLAYENTSEFYSMAVRGGVFLGSVVSGLVGACILKRALAYDNAIKTR